jgi:hypothetical protein
MTKDHLIKEGALFQVLGWVSVDAHDAKRIMDTWGKTDIREVGAMMAFAEVTELQPNQGFGEHHFAIHDGKYTIRLNVQDQDNYMLVSPDDLGEADIHVTVFWNDWMVLFMGWQWSKILSQIPATTKWGKGPYHRQSGVDTRAMSELMEQIKPEKMKALRQEKLL